MEPTISSASVIVLFIFLNLNHSLKQGFLALALWTFWTVRGRVLC